MFLPLVNNSGICLIGVCSHCTIVDCSVIEMHAEFRSRTSHQEASRKEHRHVYRPTNAHYYHPDHLHYRHGIRYPLVAPASPALLVGVMIMDGNKLNKLY